MRITKEFTFEMSHVLTGYDGACSQIHGHSYRMAVTLEGEPCRDAASPKRGMVLDFGLLKRIVGECVAGRFDHSLVILVDERTEELRRVLRKHFERVREVDFQPTCELLAVHFAGLVKKELPEGVRLVMLRLYETATSYADHIE